MSDGDHAEPVERSLLHRAALRGERLWDRVYASFRSEQPDHLTIVGYTGYGDGEQVVVLARVLAQRPLVSAGSPTSTRERVGQMLLRFVTAELGGVDIAATFGTATGIGTSDEEGFVRIALQGHGQHGRPHPQPVALRLAQPQPHGPDVTVSQAFVVIPPPGARRIVISDIDDTVLHSGATNRVALVARTLTGAASTRIGFPGTTALFDGLRAGATGGEGNPVGYVSASPWNLYDFLAAFMRRQGLPPGPMLLRDFGIDEEGLFARDTKVHKTEAIRSLGEHWPFPAVLVGDTGEHDPEIFARVAHEAAAPSVEAVLLRHVSTPGRRAAVLRLGRDLDVPWIVGDDALDLAAGAEQHGLVAPGTTRRVREALS